MASGSGSDRESPKSRGESTDSAHSGAKLYKSLSPPTRFRQIITNAVSALFAVSATGVYTILSRDLRPDGSPTPTPTPTGSSSPTPGTPGQATSSIRLEQSLLVAAIVLMVVLLVAGCVYLVYRRTSKKQTRTSSNEPHTVDLRNENGPNDDVEWGYYQRALHEFRQKTQNRAALTNYLALAATVMGFLALMTIASLSLRHDGVESKVTFGIVAVFSTTLTAYIAKLFISMSRDANKALDYYFQEPLVMSYLHKAEQLAQKSGVEDPELKKLLVSTCLEQAGASSRIAHPAMYKHEGSAEVKEPQAEEQE